MTENKNRKGFSRRQLPHGDDRQREPVQSELRGHAQHAEIRAPGANDPHEDLEERHHGAVQRGPVYEHHQGPAQRNFLFEKHDPGDHDDWST